MRRRRFVAAPEFAAEPREVFVERSFGMEAAHQALGVSRVVVGASFAEIRLDWGDSGMPDLHVTRRNPAGAALGVSFNVQDLDAVRALGATLLQLAAAAAVEIDSAEGSAP